MKRNILLISLLIVILALFTFCTGGSTDSGDDGVLKDHQTEWDKYYADETPEMWNNVWVHSTLEEDPNNIEYNLVIGISKLAYEEFEGNQVFAVTYRLLTDLMPNSGWGQDRKTITIRQGENFSSGREPSFRCVGGNERDEATHNGLIDYTGAAYTPYPGLTPTIIDKETFENVILANVSDSDKEFLLSIYEHGTPPAQLEGYRVDATIKQNLRGEDLDFFNEAYKKERETARWYNLQEGVDTEKLLDLLAKSPELFSSADNTYDYRNNYIRKWDLVEQPKNPNLSWLFLGMKKDDWKRCKDLFFGIGYIPSLEWTLYFETTTEDRQSGETRVFDPYQPFRAKENCTTGCYDFINVWAQGEVEGYETPEG
jgi:hypothetical protein